MSNAPKCKRCEKTQNVQFNMSSKRGFGNYCVDCDKILDAEEAKTDEPSEQHEFYEEYDYLNKLRDSGKINMLGAAPYLQAMSKSHMRIEKARKILALWIESF